MDFFLVTALALLTAVPILLAIFFADVIFAAISLPLMFYFGPITGFVRSTIFTETIRAATILLGTLAIEYCAIRAITTHLKKTISH